VGPRASLDMVSKTKVPSPPPGTELRSSDSPAYCQSLCRVESEKSGESRGPKNGKHPETGKEALTECYNFDSSFDESKLYPMEISLCQKLSQNNTKGSK
jgi:hypothetical protein